MQAGAITSSIDVAQLTLYAFWLFFAGLIVYLRKQDRKEGYSSFDPHVPPAEDVQGEPTRPWEGAPIRPIGNPLLAGVGPGAWSVRSDEPEVCHDDQLPRVVPIGVATGYKIAEEDPDPRGYEVYGTDGHLAGEVVDIWIDRFDQALRFFEVELYGAEGVQHVLVPELFAVLKRRARELCVSALTAAQFAGIPRTRFPAQISQTEEERITAYFAAGTLMCTETRSEPLL